MTEKEIIRFRSFLPGPPWTPLVLTVESIEIYCRVFSRGGRGGDGVPPQILGGKASPPRGGTHFDLGKKGYGGWLGSPAQTPIWDTTYVTRTRKKRGGREPSAREARLIPFLASL